jgi:trafficking protein particle complex subunit 9
MLTLAGVPRETGLVTVRGCTVSLFNCEPKEFLLPAWSEELQARQRKHTSLGDGAEKVKEIGLDGRRQQAKKSDDRVEHNDKRKSGRKASAEAETVKWLECKIVEALPLLKIKETSLVHEALMLYDGERLR